MVGQARFKVPGARPVVRPPLKWAGGKRWLVPKLRALYSRHRGLRLVEPFVGGLSVALGLGPSEALLNDANPHLIGLYRHLQKGLAVTVPFLNDPDVYEGHRSRFNSLINAGHADGPEAAQLFYYLNRTGFNGLCRFNQAGMFNVPMGRYKTIPYRREFAEYRGALRGWKFSCGDFQKIRRRGSDFIYADPPYDATFSQYSKDGFTWDDQVRLAKWLATHSGPVVASNSATARVLDLYESLGFQVATVKAPRRISSDGNREDVLEMLATNELLLSV